MSSLILQLGILPALLAGGPSADVPDLRTWDGRHSIQTIDVTVVYFLPKDRRPLPDWRERVDYFAKRIERFHEREFNGQSKLKAHVRGEPFQSAHDTAELRVGDADRIFFKTLREVDEGIKFGRGGDGAFPILLVLSDINWRPLDDFYRLSPRPDGGLEFEGTQSDGWRVPGARSGGARATYLSHRGVGWGLVSADGWRVPYRGSDCVAYHEGVGHPIGLPHTDRADGNVMSLGQYQGWINESWVDEDQKRRLGWTPPEVPEDRSRDLFSTFRASPEPKVPRPGEPVSLAFDWPEGAKLASLKVECQTDLFGPWREAHCEPGSNGSPPRSISLGSFDHSTPVSYRVRVVIVDDDSAEVWGYFQVRTDPEANPEPSETVRSSLLKTEAAPPPEWTLSDKLADREINLMERIDPERDTVLGAWTLKDGRLESPKQYAARIELPGDAPEEYLLTVVAEPLDEPNGLILGQRLGGQRFLILLDYASSDPKASAIENIDGRNVGNETTFRDNLFRQGKPSKIVSAVRTSGVRVIVDGDVVIDWKGRPDQLSLADYWTTPRDLPFLGAYDCRYKFHRVGLTPLD